MSIDLDFITTRPMLFKALDKKTDYISRCQTCAYYNPKAHHCGRYLRGVETAVYLCHRIDAEEMKAVSEKEGVYGEYLND